MLSLLFCGLTVAQSNDVSCLKGLKKQPGFDVTVLDAGHFFLAGDSLLARIARRILKPLSRRALRRALLRKVAGKDVLIVFKGNGIDRSTLRKIKMSGTRCVVYFPDGHPHSYGAELKDALGEYDLVISAKVDHLTRWTSEFGYSNPCAHVPHGYDPDLHLSSGLVDQHATQTDLAMIATARGEYFDLLREMVAEAPELVSKKVVIGGAGWEKYTSKLPRSWQFLGPLYREQYVSTLRNAAIVIAPIQRKIVIDGVTFDYDSDSARTYEIAAMGVFFLHRHSALMPQIFDSENEVPLFRNGKELAHLAQAYLDQPEVRGQKAQATRDRAVPSYSWDNRAALIAHHLIALVGGDTADESPGAPERK